MCEYVFTIFSGNEDYDAFEEVAKMDVAAVARELEEASNIKDLEERLVCELLNWHNIMD